MPRADSLRRRQQPFVEMAGEHQPVRHGGKDSLEVAVLIRRSIVVVPEIGNDFRVQPGFDVGEEAASPDLPGAFVSPRHCPTPHVGPPSRKDNFVGVAEHPFQGEQFFLRGWNDAAPDRV